MSRLECMQENPEVEKVPKEYEAELDEESEESVLFMNVMQLPVEKWLKWGGIIVSSIGIISFFAYMAVYQDDPVFIQIGKSLRESILHIVHGIFYYGVGAIIVLLKGESKDV